MSQVVAHGRQFRAAPERMRRVSVPHPVGTGTAQFFGKGCMIGFNRLCGLQEEAAQHHPQTHAAYRGVAVRLEAADDRRFRPPVLLRDRQPAFGQIARESVPGERRQRYPRQFPSLTRDAKPVVSAWISLNMAERGADELARTQSRRVAEVQQKAQPLRGRWRPALRPPGKTIPGHPQSCGRAPIRLR